MLGRSIIINWYEWLICHIDGNCLENGQAYLQHKQEISTRIVTLLENIKCTCTDRLSFCKCKFLATKLSRKTLLHVNFIPVCLVPSWVAYIYNYHQMTEVKLGCEVILCMIATPFGSLELQLATHCAILRRWHESRYFISGCRLCNGPEQWYK